MSERSLAGEMNGRETVDASLARERIEELARRHMPMSAIAKKAGVSYPTVSAIGRISSIAKWVSDAVCSVEFDPAEVQYLPRGPVYQRLSSLAQRISREELAVATGYNEETLRQFLKGGSGGSRSRVGVNFARAVFAVPIPAGMAQHCPPLPTDYQGVLQAGTVEAPGERNVLRASAAVNAEIVRIHISTVLAGLSEYEIAKRAGIGHERVRYVLHGDPRSGRPKPRRIKAATAIAILAVDPTPVPVCPAAVAVAKWDSSLDTDLHICAAAGNSVEIAASRIGMPPELVEKRMKVLGIRLPS